MDYAHPAVATSARRKPLLHRLFAALALGRSRRRLGELDDHMLRDLGLTRAEARREADRSIWDAPEHWLR